MSIKLINTAQAAVNQGIKMLVHGLAGSGKTTLASTFNEPPLIISAEAGLLSLRNFNLHATEVKTIEDVEKVYNYIAYEADGTAFKNIMLDSITEVAEKVLIAELSNTKDGRKAYGELAIRMMELMRKFRDLPERNVIFTAQQAKQKDEETGTMIYAPLMPGNQLTQKISYLFDEVFALRVVKEQDGSTTRWLQTSRCIQYDAKDRSGSLDQFEPPHLGNIINKILATN